MRLAPSDGALLDAARSGGWVLSSGAARSGSSAPSELAARSPLGRALLLSFHAIGDAVQPGDLARLRPPEGELGQRPVEQRHHLADDDDRAEEDEHDVDLPRPV